VALGIPDDPLEEDKLATVNVDGEVIRYPATNEKLPETIRKRRENRAKVPKGWTLKVRRKDGKTAEYWKEIAEMVMDETGISPIPPDLWREQCSARYSMMQSYTTLERMQMAIEMCEEKLNPKDPSKALSEQLQIEWMNAWRGVLQMQKEYLEKLEKSASVAEKKTAMTKPKNLPPVIIQQNFSNGKPPVTTLETRAQVSESEEKTSGSTP